MNEFSQIIMAKVGFNSAVQGRADIPEGAEKLIIIFPKPGSNRNEKKLQKVADKLSENGHGTLLMDLWDEEEGGNPDLEKSLPFIKGRIIEILNWTKTYEHFKNGQVVLVGVENSGNVLLEMDTTQAIIKVEDNEDIDIIVKKVLESL